MILDATRTEFGMYAQISIEVPNLEDKKLYSLLKLAKEPL